MKSGIQVFTPDKLNNILFVSPIVKPKVEKCTYHQLQKFLVVL